MAAPARDFREDFNQPLCLFLITGWFLSSQRLATGSSMFFPFSRSRDSAIRSSHFHSRASVGHHSKERHKLMPDCSTEKMNGVCNDWNIRYEDWLKMVRKVRANLVRDVPMGAHSKDKVPPLRDLFINLWNLIVSAWQSFPHPDRNLLFFHVDLSGCWEIA